jgi:hypothetical protein
MTDPVKDIAPGAQSANTEPKAIKTYVAEDNSTSKDGSTKLQPRRKALVPRILPSKPIIPIGLPYDPERMPV